MRRWLVRVALSLLVSAGALVLAELGARLIYGPEDVLLNPAMPFLEDHPTIIWTMRPGVDTWLEPLGMQLQTNSLGLRDEEIAQPKPPGELRILSLGESTTWGHAVAWDQSYSEQLEDRLEARQGGAGAVQVVNAGHGAWTIWQSATWLKERGLALEPDMVMAYHLANDFLPRGVVDPHHFLVSVRHSDWELYQIRAPIAPLLSVAYTSRLYLALRKLVLRVPAVEDSEDWSGDTFSGVRVPSEDRERAWWSLIRACRERDIPLVVLEPLYREPGPYTGDTFLRQLSRERGVFRVDLPGAWREAGEPLGGAFWVDRGHPSAAGHALLAKWIEQGLLEQGLLTEGGAGP